LSRRAAVVAALARNWCPFCVAGTAGPDDPHRAGL